MANQNHRRNFISLIGVHLSWAALSLFISVFLVARIFIITGNLGAVAWFNIVYFTAIALAFIPVSMIVKKHSRVVFLYIATVLMVLFIALIIFMQDSLVDYYIFYAGALGIVQGFYWTGMHALGVELMAGKKMMSFQAVLQIGQSTVGIVFPLVLGIVIDLVAFRAAAVLALIMGAMCFVFALHLRQEQPIGTKLSLRGFFRAVKSVGQMRAVWLNFCVQFFMAMLWLSSIFTTVLIITVFGGADSYGGSLELGLYTSLFAVCAITLIMLYRTIKNRKFKKTMFAICGVVPVLLAIPLLFEVNALTLLVAMFGVASLGLVVRVEAGRAGYNVMKEIGKQEWLVESNLLIEFVYLLTRIIFLSVMLLAFYLDAFIIFQILFVVLASSTLWMWILINRFKRSCNKLR